MHFSSNCFFNAIKKRYRNPLKFISVRYTHKSSLNLWNEELSTDIKLKIEQHWKDNINRSQKAQNGEPFYILPMFPYPSGNLHMGHVRVYSISDAMARFHKLSGKNVIHPMGWDAFGLPAENAAIERNIPPDEWTHKNISNMKKQLMQLAFDFDWDREFSTCDPEYYKWTQYIFLKLHENGLAYQNKATVNWDPADRTVLADEQVDAAGRSWRSGAPVQRRVLTQWFVKTTRLAQQLHRGLDDPALENWKDIVNLQKHWIGECDGVVVTFTVHANGERKPLDVWTAEPAKLIHGQFVTINRSHIIVQELGSDDKVNIKVYNPITESELPVYISDHDRYPEGRDVYIAAPALDAEDEELALSLGVPWSKDTNTIDVEKDNSKAVEIAQNKKVGGYFVSSKLKDWLISRQRYWGTPIPIVHCDKCGAVPVPYEDLPVKLPERRASGSVVQSLKDHAEWGAVDCPRCGGGARRETDTMDTFVDSSWYYCRFLDPANARAPFAPRALAGRLPVHTYVGGKEHAVLHLYYARFMCHFLHSLGWTPSAEPFKKLIVQGMVMGQSYKLKSSGKYIPPEDVYKDGKVYKQKETDEAVLVQWEKMSKSKYNGVNPENLLKEYGCDTTRMFILADVPPVTSRNWSDATFPGILNWQKRLWLTMREFLRARAAPPPAAAVPPAERARHDAELRHARNYYTATATYHYRHTHMISVAISRLQALTGALRRERPAGVVAHSAEFERALAALVLMLSPAAPHLAAELWAGLRAAPGRLAAPVRWDQPLPDQDWPTVDDDFGLSFQCKVDGADRCDIQIPARDLAQLTEAAALQTMLARPEVARRAAAGVAAARLDLFPGCRAVLHVRTHKKKKPKEPLEATSAQ